MPKREILSFFDLRKKQIHAIDQYLDRAESDARYINKHLNRSGTFWQSESYDIYIRNEKMLNNVISYVLMNPVNARLCDRWEEYAGNYLKDMGE